jgi:hypothetical protein
MRQFQQGRIQPDCQVKPVGECRFSACDQVRAARGPGAAQHLAIHLSSTICRAISMAGAIFLRQHPVEIGMERSYALVMTMAQDHADTRWIM